ncbi:hypothetical protein ACFPM0_01345 [Pseudonocardia sulfidoxydans]|uniref:hypothetical protein n=1 Tax=Pseudonocardia sulfidoxydans TaxID=54011 RepID=UPI0036212971
MRRIWRARGDRRWRDRHSCGVASRVGRRSRRTSKRVYGLWTVSMRCCRSTTPSSGNSGSVAFRRQRGSPICWSTTSRVQQACPKAGSPFRHLRGSRLLSISSQRS